MITPELRSDVDESIWKQNTVGGKVYTLPYHQLQKYADGKPDLMRPQAWRNTFPRTIPWPTGPRRNSTSSAKGSRNP